MVLELLLFKGMKDYLKSKVSQNWIRALFLTAFLALAPLALLQAQEQESLNSEIQLLTIQSLKKNKSFKTLKPADQKLLQERFNAYLHSLKLNPKNPKQAAVLKATADRLLNSSTQFLICAPEDWVCLEKKPLLTPSAEWRQDTSDKLGEPIFAGDSPKVFGYFTTAWADIAQELNQYKQLPEKEYKAKRDEIINKVVKDMRGSRTTVAEILARKIKEDAEQGLFMSMYGIDDIEDSMKEVYEALIERSRSNKLTQAVVDVADEGAPNQFLRNYDVEIKKNEKGELQFTTQEISEKDLSFSYLTPADPARWFFGQAPWQKKLFEIGANYREQRKTFNVVHNELFTKDLQDKKTADIVWSMGLNKVTENDVLQAVRSGYQYDGTIQLIKEMNKTASSNETAPIHIEWPAKGIMHNKFMIMQNEKNQKFVWTGTTNIARTCMGNENNSNMAIYLQNNAIADAYLAEFKEMYSGGEHSEKDLVTGRFHTKKRPNTPRYFKFKNGAEVRLHFSPTDDGEHRAILPMLLSAKKNDIIRISMFGGSGLEYVRAIQKAVAQGAHVKIVMDRLTSSGNTMWAISEVANLLEKNPYNPLTTGSVEVRFSNWLGQNHHKTGTLQRAQGNTEYLIVGSQNWSEGGNDMNDENMLTFRMPGKNITIAARFNQEFDSKMWLLSETVKPSLSKANIASTENER